MNRFTFVNASRLATVLVLVASSACQGTRCERTASCPANLPKEDRAAIAANTAAWLKALRAADWSGVAARYTPDATLMPPNEPAVTGRESLRKWFAAFPPIVSMDLNVIETEGCCDIAYVRGSYELAIAPPGAGTLHETGKYLEIHRKQADGTWLMLRDMFSSDSPAPH